MPYALDTRAGAPPRDRDAGAMVAAMTALALSVAPPSRERVRCQAQDSPQTLAEAAEEYYARNLGRVTRPSDLPSKSAALFRSHDLCHVIFGPDTSLADESLADARTLFSCDVGLRRYGAYLASDPAAKALFTELGYGRAIWITVRSLPRILRVVGEAFAMSRRWPWAPPPEYLQRTLADLRREFRIRVIRGPARGLVTTVHLW